MQETMVKDKIAFLGVAMRQFAENKEPIEGCALNGLVAIMDDIFCDMVEGDRRGHDAVTP